MQQDPYTPGSTRPAYLSGRGTELALIEDQAARVRALGRSGGPLLAFYGPRGTGKTSLLRQAHVDCHQAGMFTVWATGRRDVPMVETISKSLSETVSRSSLGDKAKRLLHRVDQVQVEFGVPGAKIGAQLGREAKAAAAVHDMLRDAALLARENDHHGLMVFVDEFQEASVSDRKSILIALQEFEGDGVAPVPAGVVAAGLPSIHGAVTEAATFGERSRFVEVKGLTPAAAAEALRVPAAELDVTWNDAAVAAAVEMAGSYPHKVQLVGSFTWSYARPESGGTITAGDVHGARAGVDEAMENLHRARWARATPQHRRFLQGVAGGGGDSATREEIANRTGRSANALSRPRDELIERGLIAPMGRGRVAFTIPGFGDFVRRQPAVDELSARRGGGRGQSGPTLER